VILKIPTNGKKLNKIFFISEIASTHNGSEIYLKKLTNKILDSETDYIKFQIFKNEDLCHPTSPFYKGLKKIELNQSMWKNIIDKSLKKKGVILEPFDENSYEFCKRFKKRALIKISSSEHDNSKIILDALKNFKKVFFNISGFNLNQIKKIGKIYKKYKKKIILMYGFQSFPSNPKDLRLKIISKIKKLGFSAGYADHSSTNNQALSYIMTSKAIDFQAEYIEKHITYKRKEKKPDYISSFETKEMEGYINFFKKEYFNNFNLKISKNEKKYCNIMSKFAVSNYKILKNEKLNIKKVKFLRTGQAGMDRIKFFSLIKKKAHAKKTIKKNILLNPNLFKF
tara:strand:- start:4640 stop:5659 length:1020 start_codon:yes stop_codon:yes gene_type:complete